MKRRNQEEVQGGPLISDLPAWVRDNLVLKLLDDQGLSLEVMYDRKYLNGLCTKPLIVIRGKSRLR